jgi:hypothetical protein
MTSEPAVGARNRSVCLLHFRWRSWARSDPHVSALFPNLLATTRTADHCGCSITCCSRVTSNPALRTHSRVPPRCLVRAPVFLRADPQHKRSYRLSQWVGLVLISSNEGRTACPRGLRRRSWLLGSWVRIPLETWMFVFVFLCCVVLCR